MTLLFIIKKFNINNIIKTLSTDTLKIKGIKRLYNKL